MNPGGQSTEQRAGWGEGNFIIAAISPDGRLYQVEHSGKVNARKGGKYGVYEILPDGGFVKCDPIADGVPTPNASKGKAVEDFREWACVRGFEVLGGRR
jgi:hypothetical protein